MSTIRYHELDAYLNKQSAGDAPSWPCVCLLFGEEFLYKKAIDRLVTAILGNASRDLNYEVVEGLNENVRDALERINTYSLLASRKIITLAEARLFHSQQNLDRVWDRTVRAGQAGEIKKAARYFLDVMRIKSLAFDDLAGESPEVVLKPPGGDGSKWIPAVLEYCHQKGLKVPAAANPQEELQAAIEKGFPTGHHLFVTTSLVDKRRRLYKVIHESGMIVDCSVPKGDRKAERMAQERVLDATVAEVLQESGKKIDPGARRTLYDMTGFDLRTVANSVEKLVHFTDQRMTIGIKDVRAALERTRKDPLYELTEAVSNRDLHKAIFFLQSLLTSGEFTHPLPLLAAVTNQMRRLLVAKDFTLSKYGRVWRPGCSYPQFQKQVMPAIDAFDKALQKGLEDWNQMLDDASDTKNHQHRTKEKTFPRSDLFLGGKGRSPYPIYKTLQKSERFTHRELIRVMEKLSTADRQLKRAGQKGVLILEHVILAICQTEHTGA